MRSPPDGILFVFYQSKPYQIEGYFLNCAKILYVIKKEARQRELDPSGIQALRQEKSRPLLEKF